MQQNCTPVVVKIVYTDKADFKKKIKEILKELRAGKVDLTDVVFLAPKKYSNSIFFEKSSIYKMRKT